MSLEIVLEILNEFTTLKLTVFACLGLIFGSFSSAMIHRIPQGQPVFAFTERSVCPKCKTILGVRDLIPILSWLMSKGRCRHCGEKISMLYPLLELLACILAILVFFSFASTTTSTSTLTASATLIVEQLIILFAIPFLLALIVIDLQHKILPNILVFIVFAMGGVRLALNILNTPEAIIPIMIEFAGAAFLYAFLAWLTAFLIEKALKKQAMGMGDIKFFAVAGLWLGLSNLGLFCILSGILGVFLGIAWNKLYEEPRFPFGPALISSFFILLLINSSHLL